MGNENFKMKKVVFLTVFLLVGVNIFIPISSSLTLNTNNGENDLTATSNNKDFSIIIHKIRQDDEIDPLPHSGPPEWRLSIYVNDEKQVIECSGEEVIIDKILVWDDIIQDGMKFLEIVMELQELDTGVWPDPHDIADISAYVDEDYYNGKYDNTDDFENNRPAVFRRYYNIVEEEWAEVDERNDFLQIDELSALPWYITSGNFDGSTIADQNDATIWFDFSVANTAPYPPEKPTGQTIGWVNQVYIYSTKSHDDDGDKICYGWDWNGDGEIDQVTDFYDSWETASIYYGWAVAEIYRIRVCAIDEHGMVSEWSDELKIEINGPYGKTGFEWEEWSLGWVYCVYLDHFQTIELVQALRSGGNIVAAAAGLLTAIAAACGAPLPLSVSVAIITGILRLGVEVINLADRGMGIYFKAYVITISDFPVSPPFTVIWSQSYNDNAWEPPENNQAPDIPQTPTGEIAGKKGVEYRFDTITIDPEGHRIAYVFDWGDGTYGSTNFNNSGVEVHCYHNWSEEGTYEIKVKAIDVFGAESEWSDTLTIEISKKSKTRMFSNLDSLYNLIQTLFKTRF